MQKRIEAQSSGPVDWLRASPMSRRQLLRRSAIATGAVALVGWPGQAALAQGSGQVTGYFGTFNDLTGKREGWPSLEHDEVNDGLWKLIQDTGKADKTNMQFANVDA